MTIFDQMDQCISEFDQITNEFIGSQNAKQAKQIKPVKVNLSYLVKLLQKYSK